MQKILVTGASSYVGARLYCDLKKSFGVVGTYNSNRLFPELVNLDVTDRAAVVRMAKKIKPSVVVHAAANPSAGWCESNPTLAVELNEGGTKNAVEAANAVNAKVIFISSFAAINPTTLYGKTKLAGEEAARGTKAGFVVLRPSLIIGLSPNTANDRPFNRILKNITEKTPAVYDTSWKFQPTSLSHLSEVVQKAIEGGITNETIPVFVPELKSRFDIARDILAPFGIEAAPKDAKDRSPVTIEKEDTLKRLGLPTYTYAEMIAGVKTEVSDYLGSRKNG
jgi:dTDP-4-dehydrorhamnose reductase